MNQKCQTTPDWEAYDQACEDQQMSIEPAQFFGCNPYGNAAAQEDLQAIQSSAPIATGDADAGREPSMSRKFLYNLIEGLAWFAGPSVANAPAPDECLYDGPNELQGAARVGLAVVSNKAAKQLWNALAGVPVVAQLGWLGSRLAQFGVKQGTKKAIKSTGQQVFDGIFGEEKTICPE